MSLCFIEPQNAIRVIANSVGREARRQLLGEVVRAWVDEIPEADLVSHYAKAVADLDEDDLTMLAAWHASLEVGHPIANKEFLVNVFPSLGENRREALKIAAGFRGEEAFDAGVTEEQSLELCCRSCPRLAAASWRASASSSTAGIASAPRTDAASAPAATRRPPRAPARSRRSPARSSGTTPPACRARAPRRS